MEGPAQRSAPGYQSSLLATAPTGLFGAIGASRTLLKASHSSFFQTGGCRYGCPSLFMTRHARSFPAPWTSEEADGCFIIRDHNGQALTYVYFENEKSKRAAFKQLTRDEARRIAANIAKN